MNRNRTDEAAHNAGTICKRCKRETEKSIKYDKKCKLCRTAEPSPKMSQTGLERQKSGKWAFFASLSFA